MKHLFDPLYSVALLGLTCLGLTLPPSAAAQSCTPNTNEDWMAKAAAGDPVAQDIRPRDCDTVQQTPPDFRWPDVIKSGGYSVTLTYPDGRVRTLPAVQNWINWDEVLPAGTYAWSVSYSGGSASNARKFMVDGNSVAFLVPNIGTLIKTLEAKPHPRSLPDAATLATIKSQRASAISSLLRDVGGRTSASVPSAGGSANDAFNYSKYAVSSIMACVLSGQGTYCSDAIRRVMNLASWSPTGPTAYTASGVDMAARYLTWTLALGYDWLYPQLSAAQRSTILAALSARNGQMYNDIIGSRARIAKSPRDSHGNQTLSFVAVISAMVAGDLPIASSTWLPKTMPLALNAINPWGGEEGGFANSATQGSWDMGELAPLFYELRVMTGINVALKPWVRNWGRYLAYFTPPGMAGGTSVFGDGFEFNEAEHQARYGKGYTYFAPTPLGRWHMSMLKGEDPTRIEYLMAPPADFSGAQPFPAGTPNSLGLQSIGQVAMHSDLANPARTSVYFKSSPPPYGAYNHSHADQNGFVINSGGQRLAIETGYYDDYKTTHWYNWYHTTQAKNAITYDGGQGQLYYEKNNKMGYGKINNFLTTADYDVVMGDATAAYGGALNLAQRSLVYLRPNLVLVYDNLASATARQWEWNIHAVNQMTSSSDTTATLQNGGQSLCVTMLAGPTVRFTQTNRFTANPTGSRAAQWHGRFYSTTRLPNAEFIALLNVGCTSVKASATKASGTWTVLVGAQTLAIGASGITVGGSTTPTTPPPTSPAAPQSQPFSGTPINVPATFQAENYDLGGQNLAYHDTTAGNAGGQYRKDDVDIIASTDSTGGGYVVNNFTNGEWLKYTVNVATTGNYQVQLRASNNYATNVAFHVEVDDVKVTGSLLVPKTGSWDTFQWIATPKIALTAGRHVLKVVADQQYFNLNSINVISVP